jgi:hypothetical protein
VPTGRLVGEARVQNSLIFRRQRRLLPETRRLGLVPLEPDPARPPPLCGPVGIFGLIECGRAGDHHESYGYARVLTESVMNKPLRPQRAQPRRVRHRLIGGASCIGGILPLVYLLPCRPTDPENPEMIRRLPRDLLRTIGAPIPRMAFAKGALRPPFGFGASMLIDDLTI